VPGVPYDGDLPEKEQPRPEEEHGGDQKGDGERIAGSFGPVHAQTPSLKRTIIRAYSLMFLSIFILLGPSLMP